MYQKSDWKDVIIILYRGKGAKNTCSNHRPITLLSVPGKIFAHVILARIQPLLDSVIRPQQSGFTMKVHYWHYFGSASPVWTAEGVWLHVAFLI